MCGLNSWDVFWPVRERMRYVYYNDSDLMLPLTKKLGVQYGVVQLLPPPRAFFILSLLHSCNKLFRNDYLRNHFFRLASCKPESECIHAHILSCFLVSSQAIKYEIVLNAIPLKISWKLPLIGQITCTSKKLRLD